MNIPKQLAEYLQEQMDKGKEVLFTNNFDENVAIILEAVSNEPWVVYCTWYDGADDYTLCNISGKAFETLKKILNNGGKI